MSDLAALHAELDLWQAAGKTARFWWRDDDAVAATPALDRLIAITKAVRAPLGLAVIPALEEDSLAPRLADAPHVSVMQHGFRHINHALPGQKKSEFGWGRIEEQVTLELTAGFAMLDGRYGPRFTRIFVPPWNRMWDWDKLAFPVIGIKRASTFKARHRLGPIGWMRPINTHVDPIDWKHGKVYLGDAASFAQLLDHLAARRLGDDNNVDPTEPTGLLSHHLVQDDKTWIFLATVGQLILDHPAAEWADPLQLAENPQ